MPVVDVMEEKKVKCSVELKGEKYAAATECSFAFFDEAKSAIGERQKATVTGGKGECEWTAPKLAELDGLAKKATYKVFVGEEEYGGFEQDLLIWAKNVVVTAKNNKDDKGVVTYPLQKPVAVKTELVSPFELKSWTKGTATEGSAREAKVERKPYKAALFAPIWNATFDAKVHKQYVNLTGAVANEGHTLKVKVGPASDKDKPVADRLGLEGDVIHVKVEFRATGADALKNSQRNKPKPCLLVGSTETASPTKVKLGVDGAPAEFEVELGYAGGDEVTISVGVTDACDDASIKVVSWRKLYYEYMAPQSMESDLDAAGKLADGTTGTDLPVGHKQKLKTILDPVFIEYVCHKGHIFDDGDAIDGTMIEAAYVGKNGRDVHVLTGAWKDPLPNGSAFDDGKGVLSVKFRLADLTFSTRSQPKVNSITLSDPSSNVDATSDGYFVFKHSPSTGAEGTLAVDGCNWTAKIPDKEKYKVKLTITGPDASGIPSGTGGGKAAKVVATDHGEEATVLFAKSGETITTDVASTEKSKLDAFLTRAVDKAVDAVKPEIAITVHADGGSRQAAFTNIKSHLETTLANRAAAYAHPGLEKAGGLKTGAMDLDWLEYDTYTTVAVDIPTDAEPGSFIGPEDDTHCEVDIEFKLEETYEILGLAGDPQILIFSPADPDGDASTFVHELGHNLGMSIMPGEGKAAPGMPEAKHVDDGGVYYRNIYYDGEANGADGIRDGHSGGHCATGVVDLTPDDYSGLAGTCTMFGEGSGLKTLCPTCTLDIRARKLVDVRSGWSTRADDDF